MPLGRPHWHSGPNQPLCGPIALPHFSQCLRSGGVGGLIIPCGLLSLVWGQRPLMGKKYTRDNVINAIVGAIAIIVSAAAIWALSLKSTGYEREAVDRSYNYARNTPSQISRDCRGSVGVDPLKCIDQTIDTARENQRKEQNLAAQQVTAWWTAVMGGAAVFGVILSAFGVFLVYRTFRATREGNEISRQAMMAENRAWVEICPDFTKGDLVYTETGEFRLNTKFTYKNIGKTVALNVGFSIDLIQDPSFFPKTTMVDDFKKRLLSPSRRVDTWPVFPGREMTKEWEVGRIADELRLEPLDDAGHEPFFPALCMGVRYNTIFDKEGDPPHITVEVASLRYIKDGVPAYVIGERKTVPSKDLAITRLILNLTEVT